MCSVRSFRTHFHTNNTLISVIRRCRRVVVVGKLPSCECIFMLITQQRTQFVFWAQTLNTIKRVRWQLNFRIYLRATTTIFLVPVYHYIQKREVLMRARASHSRVCTHKNHCHLTFKKWTCTVDCAVRFFRKIIAIFQISKFKQPIIYLNL